MLFPMLCISVLGSFNDEVDFHRTHVWQCNVKAVLPTISISSSSSRHVLGSMSISAAVFRDRQAEHEPVRPSTSWLVVGLCLVLAHVHFRPPQKADWWFENHQRSCGGTYAKIQEPPKNESRRKPKQAKRESGVPGHQATLDSFVSVSKNSSSSGPSRDAAGHRADSPQRTAQVIDLDGDECDHEASPMQRVACPVCGHDGFSLDSINVHIDSCLGTA